MVGHVIDSDAPVSISVVGLRHRPKSLLAGSIPDLNLGDFVVDEEGLHLKVNSNGVLLSLLVALFHVSHQQGSLAAIACSDQHQFKKRIGFFSGDHARVA